MDKRTDTPPTPLDFVEAISAEASAIREDWSDPRGSLRLIQEYCDKLRAQLSEIEAPTEAKGHYLHKLSGREQAAPSATQRTEELLAKAYVAERAALLAARDKIIEEIAGETKMCEQCHRWRLTDVQIRDLKSASTDGGSHG